MIPNKRKKYINLKKKSRKNITCDKGVHVFLPSADHQHQQQEQQQQRDFIWIHVDRCNEGREREEVKEIQGNLFRRR